MLVTNQPSKWQPLFIFIAFFLASVLVTPLVHIANGHPSFLLLAIFFLSCTMAPKQLMIAAFFIGLLTDALMATPLGISSLLFVVVAYQWSKFEFGASARTTTEVIVPFALFALFYECLLQLAILLFVGGDFISLLVFRALPAFVLDVAFFWIAWVIFSRLYYTKATRTVHTKGTYSSKHLQQRRLS